MNEDHLELSRVGPIQVQRASLSEREPGMRMVLGLANRADWPDDPGPGLFIARDNSEQMIGAIWLQELMPGIIAVWPPHCENAAALLALKEAALQFFERYRVRLARALVSADDLQAVRALQSFGLAPITTIESLVWSRGRTERRIRPDLSLNFQSIRPDEIDCIAGLVQDTYEDTLDCRKLCHLLRAEDVLRSYRETRPELIHHWFRVVSEGEEIGCLFVSEDESLEQCEIAYLGVLRVYRGRGWGRRLVHYAQQLSESRGCRRLVLAVDAENYPAARLYRETGFSRYASQYLLARFTG